MIEAYNSAGPKAAPRAVGTLAGGLHPTIVSRNNAFLLAVGIIEGGKLKSITPAGSELARAIEHNIEHQVRSCWRRIVEADEFLGKIVTAVRIRRGMELQALRSHIAYSAGQPKKAGIMAGAGAVVEILKISGMLREEDGKLVAAALGEPQVPPEDTKQGRDADESQQQVSQLLSVQGTVPVVIEVQIQCTPDQLDDLAVRLKRLMQDMRTQGEAVSDRNEGASAEEN